MKMILIAIATVIVAYLIGSINFAVIFTKLFTKRDVRDFGSGNAGTTNVMRVGGFKAGALTFIFDALKGYVACMFGKLVFDYISNTEPAVWALPIYGAYICGVACMLGHVFPIFFGFKGGKGVATSVGIFAVCCPIAIISGLGCFALLLLISKIVSLSSLAATVVVVVLSCVLAKTDGGAHLLPQIIMSVAMGTIVYTKHIGNIKRLIKGEEKKIGRKKNG